MGVCRVKALISAPLRHLWDFLIRPQNMHMWSPFIQQVTGIDRPLQAGDRVTQWRKDFFRHYCQVLLVEEVISYRSLHFATSRLGASRWTRERLLAWKRPEIERRPGLRR